VFAAKFRRYENDCYPSSSTTHSKLSVEERLAVSITDGLVRVSGLETVTDVIADLEQALS
jgi:O-succinylhomoserine sulfhydrylase